MSVQRPLGVRGGGFTGVGIICADRRNSCLLHRALSNGGAVARYRTDELTRAVHTARLPGTAGWLPSRALSVTCAGRAVHFRRWRPNQILRWTAARERADWKFCSRRSLYGRGFSCAWCAPANEDLRHSTSAGFWLTVMPSSRQRACRALHHFTDRTADLTWLMRSSVGWPLTRAMICPSESRTIT